MLMNYSEQFSAFYVSGLGKALKFAACIGNAPLEEIISYRDMVYSSVK